MFYLAVFYVRRQKNINCTTLRKTYVCITGICVFTELKGKWIYRESHLEWFNRIFAGVAAWSHNWMASKPTFRWPDPSSSSENLTEPVVSPFNHPSRLLGQEYFIEFSSREPHIVGVITQDEEGGECSTHAYIHYVYIYIHTHTHTHTHTQHAKKKSSET